jgi:hypothetical protein
MGAAHIALATLAATAKIAAYTALASSLLTAAAAMALLLACGAGVQRACLLLEALLATLRWLAWLVAWAWTLLMSALGALGPHLLAAAAVALLCFGGAARRGAARRRAASAALRGAEAAAVQAEAAAVQAEAAAAHAQRRARRSEADVQALVGEMTILEMALAIEMGREMRRLLDSPGPVASEAGVTPAVAAVERLRLPGGGVPASASA